MRVATIAGLHIICYNMTVVDARKMVSIPPQRVYETQHWAAWAASTAHLTADLLTHRTAHVETNRGNMNAKIPVSYCREQGSVRDWE